MNYRARIAAAGFAMATVAAFTVACGSSSSSSSNGSDDYASCMKKNGVDISGLTASGGSGGQRPSGNPSGNPSGGPGGGGQRPSGNASGGPDGGGGPDGSGQRPSGGTRGSGEARPSGSGQGGGRGNGGFGNQAPQGVDASAWAKAQAACASLRPSNAAGGNGDSGEHGSGSLTAYLNCLSEHGINASAVANISSTDPSASAALAACAALKPASSSAASK